MSGDGCRIDELVLRLRGVAPGDARRLANEVAHRLAARLRGSHHAVAISEVHVDVPAGLDADELADAIVAQIARQAR
jgi:hypothetical protein